MRFFALLLILAALICSALVIPGQEVFNSPSHFGLVPEEPDASDLIFDNAFSQTEDSDAESWWGVMFAMAEGLHGAAVDVALNSPDVEMIPGENVEIVQGDNEEDGPDGDDDGDDSDDDDDDEDGDEDEDHDEDEGKQPSAAYLPEQSCPENHTIWELTSQNISTAKLAELLSNEDELIDLRNDPDASHTLLAPTNSSLERFLGDRPSHRALRQIEHYHIVPRFIPTDKLRRHQTIPTALRVSSLGKHAPQRIVVNLHQDEVVLNGLSRVIEGDVIATNGIIHQISHPLLPPPNTSTILRLLPGHFSTFVHGLESTKLASHFRKRHRVGGTTFAPANAAFQRLGPRVNEFLFSRQGKRCLRALLEYHIVLDRTLYSDAFYDKHGRVDEYGRRGEGDGVVHIELPTLLRRKKISVDVARRESELIIRVNGFWQVVTLDMVAADGVVQVLDEVLVPPRRIGVKEEEEGLTVDVFKEGWVDVVKEGHHEGNSRKLRKESDKIDFFILYLIHFCEMTGDMSFESVVTEYHETMPMWLTLLCRRHTVHQLNDVL